jgi:ubiquinol-cytochrome c reductase iron-sulfur subunit
MSIETRDNDTRRALRGAIKLMAVVALLAVIYAFSRTLFTADHAGDGLPLEIDLADLGPGAARQVEWQGRRYLVVHRTPAMLATLAAAGGPRLADAASQRSRQPATVETPYRSADPRYLVVLDYDTALNCPLELVLPAPPDADGWLGGLRDTCGGSRYDFAGRVLAGERALRNLTVPEHRIEQDTLLVLD